MYDALDVGKYIIYYSNKKGYIISNLKLQKLLYYIQVYFLVFSSIKRPCFHDKIEAWDFGAVIPNVYNEFKRFGSGNLYINDDKYSYFILYKHKDIINHVVDSLADYSATELVEINQHQAPWVDSYIPKKHCEITQDKIIKYYNKK